jgi:glutamate---cysteine ligase / carboxylate-amine ligase
VRDAAAIAALARALVFAVVSGVIRDPVQGPPPTSEQELLRVNEWAAARDGLHACWIDTVGGAGHCTMCEAVRRLLDVLAPCIDALGDGAAAAHAETILQRGSAAERMRHVRAHRGDLQEVVRWLADESLLGTGLDRRSQQREAP